MSSPVRRRRKYHLPLILDHIQEVTVIDNTFEDRPKSQTIMATEGSRKPDYGNGMGKDRRLSGTVRMEDIWVKLRQEPSIPERF